jgi:hypothetical protein
MGNASITVTKNIVLPKQSAERLQRLANLKSVSEDRIVVKALDILFDLSDILDVDLERREWSSVSEASLLRVWDNELDATYDNWEELYGVSTG